MTWPVLASLAGVAVSLIGVAYAIYHGAETRQIASRALRLQEEAEARARRHERERLQEKQQADLVPRIGPVPGWGSSGLLIENHGEAKARQIHVRVAGHRAEQSPYVSECPTDYGHLSPNDPPLTFRLKPRGLGGPPRLNFHITWEDELEQAGEWKGNLPW